MDDCLEKYSKFLSTKSASSSHVDILRCVIRTSTKMNDYDVHDLIEDVVLLHLVELYSAIKNRSSVWYSWLLDELARTFNEITCHDVPCKLLFRYMLLYKNEWTVNSFTLYSKCLFVECPDLWNEWVYKVMTVSSLSDELTFILVADILNTVRPLRSLSRGLFKEIVLPGDRAILLWSYGFDIKRVNPLKCHMSFPLMSSYLFHQKRLQRTYGNRWLTLSMKPREHPQGLYKVWLKNGQRLFEEIGYKVELI